MAQDSDLERTEPASQRRLEQAREKGQVPRSPELSTFAVLLAAAASLSVTGIAWTNGLRGIVQRGLILNRPAAFDPDQMGMRLFEAAGAALVALAPTIVVVLSAALFAPLLLSGWLMVGVGADFSRLSPLSGLGRMFSLRSLVELGKGIAKTALVGGLGALVLWKVRGDLLALLGEPLSAALPHAGHLVGRTFLQIVGAFALIVAVDVPYQIWNHHRQLRMTRDELRQEFKETEGNPQIKSRIRSLQREAARRRMMAEVPKADVVVTNPTHFAVAIAYRPEQMAAPRVVAKGRLLLAARIIGVAEDARVPILRTPRLARALYAHAEVGQEIPPALYNACAEVLAYVYQLNHAFGSRALLGAPPDPLTVPAELDPGELEVR